MRHGTIGLASVEVALGHLRTVEDALQAGEISPEYADTTDQLSVAVARDGCTGAHLAGNAALAARAAANIPPAQIGPFYHAATTAATSAGTNEATNVMAELGLATSRHPVHTYTNGTLGVIDALAAAATYLEHPHASGTRHAMITAGDTWGGAMFNRWSAPTPRGDGAGALLLTTEPNDPTNLALLSTATHTDAALGNLRRHGGPADRIYNRVTDLLFYTIRDALTCAKVHSTDITYLITPFGTGRPEHAAFLPYAKIDRAALAPIEDRGRQIGQLGAADLIAGLHHIERTAATLCPGDHILLLAHNDRDSAGAAVIKAQ